MKTGEQRTYEPWQDQVMSYDLAVFASRAIDEAQLHALVAESSGLEIDESSRGSVTVVRGARRRYSFTVTGPDRVEAEDVPEDVGALVLGSRYLYSIAVEGSAESEIPHAVRFGRRLAQTLDGALVDQQSDQVWSRSESRTIQKPEKEERIATVHVDWYCLRADIDPNAARLFTATAERILPEALPRRFGEHEPFQGKYAVAGAEGFAKAWAEAASLLFVSGSGPCVGGHLQAGPGKRFPDRFWSMSLTLLADPLKEPGWRDAARRLFITLADKLPAFYARAEMTRGHIWSGRSLRADSETEWSISPVRSREGWLGLPPRPMWWSWLGHPFRDYASALPNERRATTANGVIYEAATEPAGWDEIEALSLWLPPDLFAALGPNPRRQQPPPLIRAATIPAALAQRATDCLIDRSGSATASAPTSRGRRP
jgi:hypothetical protein